MIHRKYQKCQTCHDIGGNFITRKCRLKSGKIVHYVGKICIICAREVSKETHRRLWADPVWRKRKLEKRRIHRENHKKQIRKANRKYYLKNRDKISKERKLKYTPRIKNPLRNGSGSHTRKPSKNHPLRKFDFRRHDEPKTIMAN